jgi:predicted GH43/DUF377 family glycosyl hydrolase
VRDIGLAVRSDYRQRADASRVISQLFIPGQEMVGGGESRTSNTVDRVLALSEEDVETALEELVVRFGSRHDNLTAVFERHASQVANHVTDVSALSLSRRLLLGATFTHEYSLEGAAVCNPSIVAHPNQCDVAPGALRIILSYRSIGEGHHSSIGFRTGEIDVDGQLTIDTPKPWPVVASIEHGAIRREQFRTKLRDAPVNTDDIETALKDLSPTFTRGELAAALDRMVLRGDESTTLDATAHSLLALATCFYDASFAPDVDLSRRVLWPSTAAESRGMEDARFVRFVDGATERYVASYTAFNGYEICQQLLETTDFVHFSSSPLAGLGARNKGLAIFPRRIGGRYVALSRHDRESNTIAFSDDGYRWDAVANEQMPVQPWEILQLGNCGSPIELPEGWLVITHGVGPMRTYGISAVLLDLDDPTKVLAQLPKPLLLPSIDEQDGYVPNVVYSCGSLVHAGTLYLPYGIADDAISYVSVNVGALVSAFKPLR